jgi:hypothetical protein
MERPSHMQLPEGFSLESGGQYHYEKQIGEYLFLFTLQAEGNGCVYVGFKTKEYDYAFVDDLTLEQRKEIFETLQYIIETISRQVHAISTIRVSTADEVYTVSEVRELRMDIIDFIDKNGLKKFRELSRLDYFQISDLKFLKGYELLRIYERIFNQEFELKFAGKKGQEIRKRFFKAAVTAYIPEWKYTSGEGVDFIEVA